jgi:hypothetical protein
MGQTITKIHRINGVEFVPEGYFHDRTKGGELQLPFTLPDPLIEQFTHDFRLARKNEPGLSIVIPYPRDTLTPEAILRSVIVHFFVPILKQDLIVDVSGPGISETTIDGSTIRDVAAKLEWSQTAGENRHTIPPFDFAEWAVEQQNKGIKDSLLPPGNGAPCWSKELFDPNLLVRLSEEFEDGMRIALRVPMTIELKKGGQPQSFFDAFLEKDPEIARGEDHFVREGMTISKVATISRHRGTRGLVLVDQQDLSTLLGDAEGPAHTTWGESEDRPDETYVKWKSRLRFVKNSLVNLLELLAPPPEGLDVNLLEDIFSIANPSKLGGTKARKKKATKGPDGDETPEPPEIPPPKPAAIRIDTFESKRGFTVLAGPAFEQLPTHVRVKAYYDTPDGSAAKQYSPFDFVFDKGKRNSITLEHSDDVEIVARLQHSFIAKVSAKDFKVRATGFDAFRDLVVEADIMEE